MGTISFVSQMPGNMFPGFAFDPGTSAAIGAGGSLLGGIMGGKSAKSAANTQAAAGADALKLQKQMFDLTRGDYMPYNTAGQSALRRLSDLLGIESGQRETRDQIYNRLKDQYATPSNASNQQAFSNLFRNVNTGQVLSKDAWNSLGGMGDNGIDTGVWKPITQQGSVSSAMTPGGQAALDAAVQAELDKQQRPGDYGSLLQPFDLSKFIKEPGYQFRLDEGTKALERGQAARGSFLSGAAMKDAARYGQDYASGEYGNAYNRYNTDQGNIYNRLMGVTNVGQNAVAGQSASAANYGNAAGELMQNIGNVKAAGIMGGSNAMNQGFANMFGGTQYGGGGFNLSSLFAPKQDTGKNSYNMVQYGR